MSQPFTVFAVAMLETAYVNDNDPNNIMDGDDGTNSMRLQVRAPVGVDPWAIDGGTGLLGGAADDNWNIWCALFNGASSEFWLNGVSEASGNAGTDTPDGITIGARYDNTYHWNGDIVEIIIYDAGLSDADKNEVGGYLADRYNLSWSDIS